MKFLATTYTSRITLIAPEDEEAAKAIVARFAELVDNDQFGFKINPPDWTTFLEFGNSEDDPTTYQPDLFAEWVHTVWEFANFLSMHVGVNNVVLALAAFIDGLVVDTDGDLNDLVPSATYTLDL